MYIQLVGNDFYQYPACLHVTRRRLHFLLLGTPWEFSLILRASWSRFWPFIPLNLPRAVVLLGAPSVVLTVLPDVLWPLSLQSSRYLTNNIFWSALGFLSLLWSQLWLIFIFKWWVDTTTLNLFNVVHPMIALYEDSHLRTKKFTKIDASHVCSPMVNGSFMVPRANTWWPVNPINQVLMLVISFLPSFIWSYAVAYRMSAKLPILMSNYHIIMWISDSSRVFRCKRDGLLFIWRQALWFVTYLHNEQLSHISFPRGFGWSFSRKASGDDPNFPNCSLWGTSFFWSCSLSRNIIFLPLSPGFTIISLVRSEASVFRFPRFLSKWSFDSGGGESSEMSLLDKSFYLFLQVDTFISIVAMISMETTEFLVVSFTWV